MTARSLDDCFTHDGRLLRHDEAIAILESRISPIVSADRLSLAAAHGRVISQAIVAPHPVPPHTNSAVDGYAFAFADYDPVAGSQMPVYARATAGHPLAGPHQPGGAVRIFTGAALPQGCDSVVMQEDVSLSDTPDASSLRSVALPSDLKKGRNVRRAGEDLEAGQKIFEAGHRIRAQDIAALASIGVGEVECFRRLRVAVISTGDEVIPAGQTLQKHGQVYDANAPMLMALLSNANADANFIGILPDRPEIIRKTLADAAKNYDVILTTGGASRGDEDHLVAAIDALGQTHLWQLAIKPGRPLSFGNIGQAVIVGMPGNPVAVLVCFLMHVWPMLARLAGETWPVPQRYPLPAVFSFAGRKTGRREFWRGTLVEQNGSMGVDKYRRDGSGLISGLREADGLIDIPEDSGDIAEGDMVSFIPFAQFGILGRP